jgi:hypothetical protein
MTSSIGNNWTISTGEAPPNSYWNSSGGTVVSGIGAVDFFGPQRPPVSGSQFGFPLGSVVSTDPATGGIKRIRPITNANHENFDRAKRQKTDAPAYNRFQDFFGNPSGKHAVWGRVTEAFNLTGSTSSVGSSLNALGFNNNMDYPKGTMGFTTNGGIPGNELFLKAIEHYETPGTNDLVIVARRSPQEQVELSSISSGMSNALQGPPFSGFTLAGFNFLIAQAQEIPILRTDISTIRTQIDAHKMLINNYDIVGVCDTENFSRGGSSFSGLPNGKNEAFKNENKVINYVMEGGVKITDFFGPVSIATRLFLIWKKVDAPVVYWPDTRGTGSSPYIGDTYSKASINLTVTMSSGLTRLSQFPFQLVPYADPMYPYPPDDQLIYVDETGRKRHGIVFQIGIVNKSNIFHSDPFKNENQRNQIQRDCISNLKTSRQSEPLDILYDCVRLSS